MSKDAVLTLTFEIPVEDVGVSPDGDYLNLPTYLQGWRFVHGKWKRVVVISDGRLTMCTDLRPASEWEKPEKAPTINADNLI